MDAPTPKQLDTLRYIVAFVDRHAYAPTMRHLADYHGISIAAVYDRIAALRSKGLIDSSAIRSTHATPTDEGRKLCAPRRCPKCGCRLEAA